MSGASESARFLTRAQAETRLLRGDILRMQLGERGTRLWWFEAPFAAVSDPVVSALTQGFRPPVRLVDSDSLFGIPFSGQTWQAIRGTA